MTSPTLTTRGAIFSLVPDVSATDFTAWMTCKTNDFLAHILRERDFVSEFVARAASNGRPGLSGSRRTRARWATGRHDVTWLHRIWIYIARAGRRWNWTRSLGIQRHRWFIRERCSPSQFSRSAATVYMRKCWGLRVSKILKCLPALMLSIAEIKRIYLIMEFSDVPFVLDG